MQELQEIERIEEQAGLKSSSPDLEAPEKMSGSFMSESVYGKLNSPQARKRRAMRIASGSPTNGRTHRHSSLTKAPRSWN
jgi:hypothetical protein